MAEKKDRRGPTSAQLRDDITRGKAGDKVKFPDPAAAPLGTDAEASGNPPTREELEIARCEEIEKRPDEKNPPSHGGRPVSAGKRK